VSMGPALRFDFRARSRRREAALLLAQQAKARKYPATATKKKGRKVTVAEHIRENDHLEEREPTLNAQATVGECLTLLRNQRERDRLSELGLAWVVDDDKKLVGYVGAAELLLSPPGVRIADIAKPSPSVVLRMREPLEEATHALRRAEDLAVAPVVDDEGVLVAAFAPSEVIAALEFEATEDVAKIALSGDASSKSYFEASLENVVKDRAKWLLSLLLFQSLSSVVLESFAALLRSNLTLALFLTMITGTSGNAGNQTSAVVIRGLATGEIVSKKDAFRVLTREFKVALPLAIVLSVASFFRVFFSSSASAGALLLASKTALAITLAMGATVFSAIAIGAGAPLLLDALGVDPANCASPTLATFVDLLGVLCLCTVGTALLPTA